MEIRIDRQNRKIQKFENRADASMEAGNYNEAANNYRYAIGSTATQISNQENGAKKYKTTADSVLNKAIKNNVISKKAAKTIAKGVADGSINISSYSKNVQEVINAYKSWYEKSLDCAEATETLHQNIRKYISDLKDVRDTQRDVKLDRADLFSTIGTSGYTSTSGTYYGLAQGQLSYANTQLANQNTAYSTATSNSLSDATNLGNTANSAVTTQINNVNKTISSKTKNYKILRQKYKTALKNAQSAIKNKKPVATADLNVIKKYSTSTYEQLYAYNIQLDNVEAARLEEATAYAANSSEIYKNTGEKYKYKDSATNNKIDLLKSKADNANGSTNKNKYLTSIASQYDTILTDDKAEITEYTNDVNTNSTTIRQANYKSRGTNYKNLGAKGKINVDKYIDSAKKSATNGTFISASVLAKLAEYYSKGYITAAFYKSCIDYNNALEMKREAEAQYAIDQQTAIAEKAALGTEMVSNVEQDYTNKLNSNQVTTNKLQTQQNLKSVKGIAMTRSDYNSLITQSQRDQTLYTQAADAIYKQIQSNIANGYWSTSSQEYKDAMQSYESYKLKADECAISQVEYNNAIASLPLQNLEKALALLDAISEYNKSEINLKAAQGIDLSEADYMKQISDNNTKIAKLNKERATQYQYYLNAMASADKVYAGQTADQWKQAYLTTDTNINTVLQSNEELKDSLRDDVFWRTFERAHQSAQKFADVLSGVKGLIDSTSFFNSDGELTEMGIAQIANLTKEYENARTEVENYTNDIRNLNSLYAQGYYTQEEYKTKLGELQTSVLSSASSMKTAIGEIMDMYKEMAQGELDVVLDLIDARKDALDAKKEYYDYDKNIREKTGDIQSLEAQLAALDALEDSQENRAKRANLESQLKDAQDKLDETVEDHMFDMSKDSLDELQSLLQDNFDDRWDNLWGDLDGLKALLESANKLTTSSATSINKTLNEILRFYGVDPVVTGVGEVTKYAKGTKGTNKNEVAWVNELGTELMVSPSDNAILAGVKKGTGVIPAGLTSNLFKWGEFNPSDFTGDLLSTLRNSQPNGQNGTVVNQNYGSLLNVEGNVDSTVISDMEGFAQTFYKGSYEYTVAEIARDARRNGIKV